MQSLDTAPPIIDYPCSDGKRMSDNMKQARWIFVLYGNLTALFADRDDVLVAADNLWYPVEGRPDVRIGPDVYVVFGRPKWDRASYKQWEEGGVPVHVAFEILSPSNSHAEMAAKHQFYEEHGVEEYYVYDPDSDHLTIWTRGPMGAAFARRNPRTFVSPRMGIRFDTSGDELVVRHPDGQPFRTFLDVAMERDAAVANARVAAAALQQAEAARQQAEAAAQAAEAVRQADVIARHAAEAAQHAAEIAQGLTDAALGDTRQRLRRIRDLGRLARAGQATPEQLAELQALEESVNGD